jgi:FkbM family methyltransferase
MKLTENIMIEDIFLPDDFEWGELSKESADFISSEIYYHKIYDFWQKVQPNDIVVDIGSSVGPFANLALQRNAQKVYCIEPSLNLLKTNYKNNFKYVVDKVENPLYVINKAISDKNYDTLIESNFINVYGNSKLCSQITFSKLIEKYKIDKINFLKIDCEGGEYSILTDENYQYLSKNVDFISCEVHGNNCMEYGNYNFVLMRDTFLKKFPRKNIKIMCYVDEVNTDVTDWIFTNQGVDHILNDTEVMLYIKNN